MIPWHCRSQSCNSHAFAMTSRACCAAKILLDASGYPDKLVRLPTCTDDEILQMLHDPSCLKDSYTNAFFSTFDSLDKLKSLSCRVSLLVVEGLHRADNCKLECRFALIRRYLLVNSLTNPYDFARASCDFSLVRQRNLESLGPQRPTAACKQTKRTSEKSKPLSRSWGACRAFLRNFLKGRPRDGALRDAHAAYKQVVQAGGAELRKWQAMGRTLRISRHACRRLGINGSFRQPRTRATTRRLPSPPTPAGVESALVEWGRAAEMDHQNACAVELHDVKKMRKQVAEEESLLAKNLVEYAKSEAHKLDELALVGVSSGHVVVSHLPHPAAQRARDCGIEMEVINCVPAASSLLETCLGAKNGLGEKLEQCWATKHCAPLVGIKHCWNFVNVS